MGTNNIRKRKSKGVKITTNSSSSSTITPGSTNTSSLFSKMARRLFVLLPAAAILVPFLLLILLLSDGDGTKVIDANTVENEPVPNAKVMNEAQNSSKRRQELFVGDHYILLKVLPHDSKAFTQGFTYHNGFLYEGTGLNGQSEIRKLSPDDPSKVLQSTSLLPHQFFGEGITFFRDQHGNERIIQITWQGGKGFIYDANTLNKVQDFQYQTTTGEGWGITYDEHKREFIVSDGGKNLHFWDRDTLQEKRRIMVTLEQIDAYGKSHDISVGLINELEFVRADESSSSSSEKKTGAYSFLLANVWYQDVILKIDPDSGKVTRIYDFSKLYTQRTDGDDVFNGISVSGENDGTFYVTGKLWPHVYKVQLLD